MSSGHSSTSLSLAGGKKVDTHQTIGAKLALCTALLHLLNGNSAKAMQDFLQPMSEVTLAPWAGSIISMGDVGVYAHVVRLQL
jgi:hypothetical protein